jgi:beta-aspartyl-peptidase (threonine type)
VNTVFVHGGVSGLEKPTKPSLAYALEHSVRSATAVDAVEAAVVALEDDPQLNAGYGAVLTRDGTIELDAGIADGSTGDSGAVANVSVANPVRLARVVMHETPHLLVAGPGAMALAGGLPALEQTTDAQRERWEKARAAGTLEPSSFGAPEHVDTVGAVALDSDGRLAAASSTGGVFGKLRGRIGDAPIFGAGLYASRNVAVVGTGVGELFLETLASLRVGMLVEEGIHPQEACERVVHWVGARRPVSAGLLALDAAGRAGAAFRGGSLAIEGPGGPVEAVRLD